MTVLIFNHNGANPQMMLLMPLNLLLIQFTPGLEPESAEAYLKHKLSKPLYLALFLTIPFFLNSHRAKNILSSRIKMTKSNNKLKHFKPQLYIHPFI